MDIFRLDDHLRTPASPTWIPVDIIEEINNVIWTERFDTPGDFEFVTPDIMKVRAQLPVGSLVGMRNTYTPMMVTKHEYSQDDEGAWSLKIMGKTLDWLLDWRYIRAPFHVPGSEKARANGESWKMQRSYTAVEAAAVLLWDSMCDLTSPPKCVSYRGIQSYHGSPWPAIYRSETNIKRLLVSTGQSFSGTRSTREITDGTLASAVKDLLAEDKWAVRFMLPPTKNFRWINNVSKATGHEGEITFADNSGYTDYMRLDLFHGIDRSRFNTSGNKVVVFDYYRGDFVKSSGLHTLEERPNYIFARGAWTEDGVNGSYHFMGCTARADNWVEEGLSFRASQVEPYCEMTKRNEMDWVSGQYSRLRRDIKGKGPKLMFAGEVTGQAVYRYATDDVFLDWNAPDAKPRFQQDFRVGDSVSIRTPFGEWQQGVIKEYVMSSSADEGISEYPVLELSEENPGA